METFYVCLETIILYSLVFSILAKPFEDEKSFNDDKLRCTDANEGLDYERNNVNPFSDYYKPRARFEGSEKYPNRPFDYDKKRSASDEVNSNVENSLLQKRQVGVVYKDDKPVGILQPYQRSYRFIPVKDDDNSYGFDGETQGVSYNLPSFTDIDKREISNGVNIDPTQLDESYPSILTNFKIVNKLDKKRNYDALTEENVRDLKATIRRLRSSNARNNEQIEEELKDILDDMGLIEDEEIHGEKREVTDEQIEDESDPLVGDEIKSDKEREKRDDLCVHNENSEATNKGGSEHSFINTEDKRNELKNDVFNQKVDKRESIDDVNQNHRKKRQKQETVSGCNKENSELVENLKDSGDIMFSGNKSPLASSSEITVRDADNKELDKTSFDDEDEDYEKRVERQIQSKINSLKEQVKREIETLTKRQNDDEDMQRKKRQVVDNLMNEETEELDPAMNPDGELKPLVRKRRDAIPQSDQINSLNVRNKRETLGLDNRVKRMNDHSTEVKRNQENYKSSHKETDEGGDLLGGDDFDEGTILKREVYTRNERYGNYYPDNSPLYQRSRRSDMTSDDLDLHDNYFYNNYFYKNNDRPKRQNDRKNYLLGDEVIHRFVSPKKNKWRLRLRRRINENQLMPNRPQQLSDMSDLDLFGALPKSYDGELSRYKRVKRK